MGTVVQKATMVQLNSVTSSTHNISFSSTPATGNAVSCSGTFTWVAAQTISSITDNQGGGVNTYELSSSAGAGGGYNGKSFLGTDTSVTSSGTFTVTVTQGASVATWGAIGLMEVSGLKNQTSVGSGTTSNFNITSNDVNVSTSSIATTDQFLIGVLGIINFSAMAVNGATGYTNQYDNDVSGSYPGYSCDTKNDTTGGVQTIQFSHDNASLSSAGIGILFAYENAPPPTIGIKVNRGLRPAAFSPGLGR